MFFSKEEMNHVIHSRRINTSITSGLEYEDDKTVILFMGGLFNGTVCSSYGMASNDRMISE
jgi:hypothetical protein